MPTRPPTASWLRVGEQVFCPRHRIGTIRERRPRHVLGRRRVYLTIELTRARMRTMLPADNAARLGLRPPSTRADARRALAVLASEPAPLAESWQARSKHHKAKLTTGSVTDIAEVVRDLAAGRLDKRLASSDRDAYQCTRALLIDDLTVALELDEPAIATRIDDATDAETPQTSAARQPAHSGEIYG